MTLLEKYFESIKPQWWDFLNSYCTSSERDNHEMLLAIIGIAIAVVLSFFLRRKLAIKFKLTSVVILLSSCLPRFAHIIYFDQRCSGFDDPEYVPNLMGQTLYLILHLVSYSPYLFIEFCWLVLVALWMRKSNRSEQQH